MTLIDYPNPQDPKAKRPSPIVYCPLPFIFIFLLLAPTFAHACIGDTKKELSARYGVGKDVGFQRIYTRNGISINVFFDKEQLSAMEVFSKRVDTGGAKVTGTEEELFQKQPELTQEEITQILKDNSGKYGWGDMQTADGVLFWFRSDRKVVARYIKKEKAMILMSVN